MDKINSINFDERLGGLLKTKKSKNCITGRFDIESIDIANKPDFVINFLSSFEKVSSITYKILFWETDKSIKEFFNMYFYDKNYKISKPYKEGSLPGNIFIDDQEIDKQFLKNILNFHFNYELAIAPSINIRVQICVNQEMFSILLDIYDDRGMDLYFLPVKRHIGQ